MLDRIETIEGRPPDEYVEKTALYDATALDPQPVMKLEHNPAEPTTRIIDILAPVGFGQRGLMSRLRAPERPSFCKTSPRGSTTTIPMSNSCCC